MGTGGLLTCTLYILTFERCLSRSVLSGHIHREITKEEAVNERKVYMDGGDYRKKGWKCRNENTAFCECNPRDTLQ